MNGTDSSLIQFSTYIAQYYLEDSIYRMHNSICIFFENHLPNDILDTSQNPPDLFEPTFRSLLKVSDYNYTYDSRVKHGVIVCWYDNNGTMWISGKNSVANFGFPIEESYNSNSNFKIVFSEAVPPRSSFYTWSQEIHVTLHCTLYNNLGDSLTLKNGKFNAIYSYKKQ